MRDTVATTAAVDMGPPWRPVGRSDLRVSPLCFGGNVFGWTADESASHALLDRFVAAGGNFIDTANVYSRWVPGHSGGESEAVLGRWLRQRCHLRDRLVVATKVGLDMPGLGKGLSRAQIVRSVDDSLRRLQLDHVDLLYAHADDVDTPLEDTLDVFNKLVQAGKTRAIGASNYGASRLEQALRISEQDGMARFECLQPLFNLLDRSPVQDELAPLCLRAGISVAPYYSLASGFLSGKYRQPGDLQGRPRTARLSVYDTPRGWRVVEALQDVAKRLDAAPASIAVAWVLAQPGITSAIASATLPGQLDELMHGATLRLDAKALSQLDEASVP